MKEFCSSDFVTYFCFQAQKKDQSKFYGDLLEKRRTDAEKEQET